MGGLIKTFLVLIGLAALVLVGTFFVLRRADIPYETLASRYESAASRYIDLPGNVHMHYRDEGQRNGPTLLLVHGYSSSLHTWEPWVAKLGDEYRVVSIDLPGHGLTRAPAGWRESIPAYVDVVNDFAHAYGLTHFALAGNSMGGNIAWEYALAHPDQLDALILVDAAGWPPSAASKASEPSFFALLRNPALAPLLREIDNTSFFTKGLRASFSDPTRATDAMVTRYVELSRAPGHRDILLQIMLGARRYATDNRLGAIRTPTLVLVGDDDHLIPPADAVRFHAAIRESQFVRLEHTGHLAQEENPDATSAAVRAFLHRHTAPALEAVAH